MHPLPRSLEPLSGESLVSYLLRLGHRLGLSPLHLIRAADWVKQGNPNHFPGSLLLDLPRPQAETFARLTGQTAREVSALTLAQWRDRYPPIARSLPGPGCLMRPDAWLYVGSPRFCPSCLAGDGTAVQQLHGGPWLKLWHLPIVFACTEHRIYLEAECPHCGQPHDAQGPLIQRANDHTLHSAQCRWTVDAQTPRRRSYACAGRLDHRTALARDDRPQPTVDVLRFQKSLRGRLKSPTRTTDAFEYFTDLRLATALISTTWPQGRHLLDTDTAERIDSNSQKLHVGPGGRRNPQARDTPPRDPIACGALLMAADRLLSRDDLPDLLSDLTRAGFDAPSSRTPWAVLYDKHKNDCSERLRQAAEPATRAFPRVNGRGGTPAPHRSGYQPEHIPAFLEPDWYQRYLASYAGSASKAVRRAAAVRLVQWAMGGTYDDAAEFLGITPVQTHLLTGRETRRSVRTGCNPLELDRALRALASELQSPRQPPVDYRRRRQALHEWVLSIDAWNALVRELPPTLTRFRTLTNDRKRQDSSVFIWTLVTRGEHLFAPRPLEAAQPAEIQQQWAGRRNTTWFQFSRPDPLGHYADLRHVLAKYAQRLAREIDSGAHGHPRGRGQRITQLPRR
ncbi:MULTISPECIES: TniQ family protein [unclassified Streptomyces]|uniref:TniQ family protein n=1 Tax=unclassified Streptomyces TaxID=2593676 RepID=UPI00099DBFFA|nr:MULTISPECIES: TniQ family protein [unclassified Streptomyces]